ncbi:reverse transcriptase/maturase family protein [Levilactobacillus yonginensis]|uniref:reverse transcriptase/maturase family protein n=1 Tax=Levilactobacillus yonginensis TaxID=1054041 RepID=UPI0013DDEA6E|nr:reverse transcriptase/maturase family protein [Levilactobacillus yonginensis]
MNGNEMKRLAVKECLKSTSKEYRHFDHKISENEKKKLLGNGKKSFCNPNFVKRYRQLPFIKFDMVFNKFGRNDKHEGQLTPKARHISLASHHESLLLKYYSVMLGYCYERSIEENGIAEVPLAYRRGFDNIHGAKSVFDFLWQTGNSWIIKGDFHAFFDCLDHRILMKQVKRVLYGDERCKMSDDWYAVIKSITKYRSVSKGQLVQTPGINTHGTSYVSNLKEFGKLIKKGKLRLSSVNEKGIPQGTAISAILANVYMIGFDEWVNKLVQRYGGIYKRYSDDFVVVIPQKTCDIARVKQLKDSIIHRSNDQLKLTINPRKTKLLEYSKENGHVYDLGSRKVKNFDYLGFEFTGRAVYLRAKTIYKFHYRGKKAVYMIARNIKERDIVRQGKEKAYLKKRSDPRQIKLTADRLKITKEDEKLGHGVRYRKKGTQMYLIFEPISKRNMMAYAIRSQLVMSQPIEQVVDMYDVDIESKVKKEISRFQIEFGEIRRKLKNKIP